MDTWFAVGCAEIDADIAKKNEVNHDVHIPHRILTQKISEGIREACNPALLHLFPLSPAPPPTCSHFCHTCARSRSQREKPGSPTRQRARKMRFTTHALPSRLYSHDSGKMDRRQNTHKNSRCSKSTWSDKLRLHSDASDGKARRTGTARKVYMMISVIAMSQLCGVEQNTVRQHIGVSGTGWHGGRKAIEVKLWACGRPPEPLGAPNAPGLRRLCARNGAASAHTRFHRICAMCARMRGDIGVAFTQGATLCTDGR